MKDRPDTRRHQKQADKKICRTDNIKDRYEDIQRQLDRIKEGMKIYRQLDKSKARYEDIKTARQKQGQVGRYVDSQIELKTDRKINSRIKNNKGRYICDYDQFM